MDDVSALESALDALRSRMLTHGMGRSLRALAKELELYKKFIAGRDATLTEYGNKEVEQLQIGSGLHKLEGWTNLDLGVDADVCWDIREGLPFASDTVGVIFSEHTLEHIDYPISVKQFYKEAFRVLRPGGSLITGVPDGGLALQKYVEKDQTYFDEMLSRWYKNRKTLEHFNTFIDLINYIYRDEDDDEVYSPHFWAYDREKLDQLAQEAGFVNSRLWEFDASIANPKREWASIYVICNKPGKEERHE